MPPTAPKAGAGVSVFGERGGERGGMRALWREERERREMRKTGI